MFIPFHKDVQDIKIPQLFTFPFYYEPHPLCLIAAEELQLYLKGSHQLNHNFGLEDYQDGLIIGKMFGVLVVQHPDKGLGYLAAFSGKLADSNHHYGFVPPVFDLLEKDGFFRKEEQVLNELNARLISLGNNPERGRLIESFEQEKQRSESAIENLRQTVKAEKEERRKQRLKAAETYSKEELEKLEKELVKQSLHYHFLLKDAKAKQKERLTFLEETLKEYDNQVQQIKEERKVRSATLQRKIFEQYTFLNQFGTRKNLGELFDGVPPAGAGECAAPKLLQYAFLHNLTPIAMAEFWWGASPKSEVRKHKQFYPACKGKCEPILAHMLKGILMDKNPMQENLACSLSLEIIYEDEYLLAVNKPPELLSVPGKMIQDSVQERIRAMYPEATGPLLVHRLDMSTSGILLIAKDKDIHKQLQKQFIKREVQKTYAALLDGEINGEEGEINLPLRVDLDDRPRQLVCYEYGLNAKTLWKVLERHQGKTKVEFTPVTGRTHQLRVHSAHILGLNAPIKGDDLYGQKADRLYLHAERLSFRHPITNEQVNLVLRAEF